MRRRIDDFIIDILANSHAIKDAPDAIWMTYAEIKHLLERVFPEFPKNRNEDVSNLVCTSLKELEERGIIETKLGIQKSFGFRLSSAYQSINRSIVPREIYVDKTGSREMAQESRIY
jgi:hypothetical protein